MALRSAPVTSGARDRAGSMIVQGFLNLNMPSFASAGAGSWLRTDARWGLQRVGIKIGYPCRERCKRWQIGLVLVRLARHPR